MTNKQWQNRIRYEVQNLDSRKPVPPSVHPFLSLWCGWWTTNSFSGPQSDLDVLTERCINKMCEVTLRIGKLLKKCGSHLQILGVRKVIWSKLHTENQKFGGDLCTSRLSGTFCTVHVNRHTSLRVWKETVTIVRKILRATVNILLPGMCAFLRYITAFSEHQCKDEKTNSVSFSCTELSSCLSCPVKIQRWIIPLAEYSLF
jgi:hypothetical protein